MAIIEGSVSGILADVDSNHNLLIAPTAFSGSAGFISITGEHDHGSVTGSRINRELDVSSDYRLRVGSDAIYFNDNFSGSAINTTVWQVPVIAASASPIGGFLVLNASGSAGASMMCMARTIRTFPLYASYGGFFESVVQIIQVPQTNNVTEWGFGYASGSVASAPTDGAYFRLNAVGEFRCVVNNNGTESQSDPLNFASLMGTNNSVHSIVHINEDEVSFWIDDIVIAKLDRSPAGSNVTYMNNLPIFFRTYNTSITTLAQQLKVSMVNASQADIIDQKPWMHKVAGWGGGGYQGQTAAPLGSTALMTNNLTATSPTPVIMTNTTAALGLGLGGQFSALATATSGSSAIDAIICAYQVPLGNNVMPQRTLYVNGVWVQGAISGSGVSGSQIAGGPILYAYALNFGSNLLTLATAADALPSTKAPRRIALGWESFPAGSLSGQIGQGVYRQFTVPVVVQPGEFISVSAKNMSITPTTLGTVTFLVGFDSYWE